MSDRAVAASSELMLDSDEPVFEEAEAENYEQWMKEEDLSERHGHYGGKCLPFTKSLRIYMLFYCTEIEAYVILSLSVTDYLNSEQCRIE